MAVYIHCMAHRLNLVLVDVCKNIQCIAEFFILFEAVYVFMSSGVFHSIFVETQRRLYPNRRPTELKRLIETRWSCRFESIETLLKTYNAVLNTLAEVRDTHQRYVSLSRALRTSSWISSQAGEFFLSF